MPVVPLRHYGRWAAAVVVLVGLALLIRAFAGSDIDYGLTVDFLDHESILEGALNTVIISVAAQVVGVGLGVLAAVMRLSRNPVTSGVAWLYIWFFRGPPVLVQLLVWYNLSLVFPTLSLPGIGEWQTNSVMTPFLAALLGLGINEGAYMAEIVRAGIGSVDQGQTEAAHALGMPPRQTMRRIVLPQAMRVIVPPTGNEVINMLKTTSLVSTVQYVDLLKAAQDIGQGSGSTVEMLFLAAAWYLILTSIFSVGQYYLERYYAKGSSRSLPPTPIQRFKTAVLPVRRPKGVSA